jgi:hypothetical protein
VAATLALRSRVCTCPDSCFGGFAASSAERFRKKQPPAANSRSGRLCSSVIALEKLDVFCLEALGTLDHVKVHRLVFLKAAESTRLYGREMHENIIAGLTAKKAIALRVVKSLY